MASRFSGASLDGSSATSGTAVLSESCVSASKRRMASRVEPKIQPQRLLFAGRPQIDDAAAQGEVARLAHRAGADVTVACQEGDQRLAIDLSAGFSPRSWRPRWRCGRHPLSKGIDGVTMTQGFSRPSPTPPGGQAALSMSGLARHGLGQASPGGKRQHRQRRAKESDGPLGCIGVHIFQRPRTGRAHRAPAASAAT